MFELRAVTVFKISHLTTLFLFGLLIRTECGALSSFFPLSLRFTTLSHLRYQHETENYNSAVV